MPRVKGLMASPERKQLPHLAALERDVPPGRMIIAPILSAAGVQHGWRLMSVGGLCILRAADRPNQSYLRVCS